MVKLVEVAVDWLLRVFRSTMIYLVTTMLLTTLFREDLVW